MRQLPLRSQVGFALICNKIYILRPIYWVSLFACMISLNCLGYHELFFTSASFKIISKKEYTILKQGFLSAATIIQGIEPEGTHVHVCLAQAYTISCQTRNLDE